MRHGIQCVIALILAAGVLLFSGCRKSADTSTATKPASTPAQPAKAARTHHLSLNGISPLIVSMSPETIPVRDGHAPMVRYSLTYEINNAEKATKASISVYAPGVGELQKFDVDAQARAQIEFLLDPSAADLGPTVRLRAHCPGGDTDWGVLGAPPDTTSQSVAGNPVRINPAYIVRGNSGGVPIAIWGTQIGPGCRPEAQVDGTIVEVQNLSVAANHIEGMLMYSDLQGRPVASRYLEVKLVVYGPGMPTEDVFRLNFAE